jgi:hypothetical protein
MYTNATIDQLKQALKEVNKRYNGNISFNTLDQKTSKRVSFTLKAISGQPGSRLSHSGRKLPKASWHVHGHLFDALFSIDRNIYVLSLGKKITANSGNWEDRQIGSIASPCYFSDVSID